MWNVDAAGCRSPRRSGRWLSWHAVGWATRRGAQAFLAPFGVAAGLTGDIQQRAMAAGSEVARESVVRLAEFFGSAVDLIFVMILSFYFASVGESIAHWLQTETPPSSTRYRAQVLVAVVNRVVGGYIRGTLMLAIIIGVLLGAGLAVIGVQYAVLLGVLQFFMQFILILGVIITGTAAVVITLANVLLLLTSIRSTASHLSRKNGVRTDTIVPQDCES